jgi:hypothetical protein
MKKLKKPGVVYMPVFLAHGRQKQKDHKSESSLNYIVISVTSGATRAVDAD